MRTNLILNDNTKYCKNIMLYCPLLSLVVLCCLTLVFYANYHVIDHKLVHTKFMDNSWQFMFLFCCASSVLPFFTFFFSALALFAPFSSFFLSEVVFYFFDLYNDVSIDEPKLRGWETPVIYCLPRHS